MSIYKFFHHIPIYDKIEDSRLGEKSMQILANYNIGLASEVHYKCSIKVADELNEIEGKEGDVVVDTTSQSSYLYSHGDWLLLSKGNSIHYDNERSEDDISNEIRKVRSICSHCGGVLIPNLYSEITVCAYCDCANSTFVYKTDPEFNKI